MRKTALILLLTFVCAVAQAQIRIVPREKLESVGNPRHSSDSAFLKFDKRHINHEMAEDDNPAVFRFRMWNSGNQILQIKRLVSSCSCASAICDRQVMNPGDSASVTVTYNPKGHFGRFERKVFIYTREGDTPAATLRLNVNVNASADSETLYPYQIGNLGLRRKEISFSKGHKSVEHIPVINRGNKAVRLECIREMLPQCLAFSADPVLLGAGEEGKIIVIYDPTSSDGEREQMHIVMKGLGGQPSQSSITVKIK